MVTVFLFTFTCLSCTEGQSVLVSLPCLDDLVSFMYAVYDSMLIDVSEQFDMLPVELKLRSENLTSENASRCFITNDVCETVNKEIAQSNKCKPVPNSRQKEINSGKTLQPKTKINLMKITGVNLNNEESNNTLIEKYFNDQMDRNKCKQNAVKSQIDRKLYLHLYKQKQRESLLFKKERKHKKAIRESDENRMKNKMSTLISMRAARMSADYKSKERYAKRAARESDEIRKNDKKLSLKSKKAARMSADFEVKERCAKRFARESDEVRIKDKLSTLKSMRAARMSADFKSKEKCAKRSARESDEIRIKDKMSTVKSMRAARMSADCKSKERCAKRL